MISHRIIQQVTNITPYVEHNKVRHKRGGTPLYNSNNSAPTMAHKQSGVLAFMKVNELCYALIVHRSSPHLIALGRLIESIFTDNWHEKLPLDDERVRIMSTRLVVLERIESSMVVISDLCELHRPQVIIDIVVLKTILNRVQAESVSWLSCAQFPEYFILEVDGNFQITIVPLLFKSVANC